MFVQQLPVDILILIDTYVCSTQPILSQVCRRLRTLLHFRHLTVRTGLAVYFVCSTARVSLLRIDFKRPTDTCMLSEGVNTCDNIHVLTSCKEFDYRAHRSIIDFVQHVRCTSIRWMSSCVPWPGQLCSIFRKLLCVSSLREVHIDCSRCDMGQRHIKKMVSVLSTVKVLTLNLSFNHLSDLLSLQQLRHMPNISILRLVIHGCLVQHDTIHDFLRLFSDTNVRCVSIEIGERKFVVTNS